MTNKFNQENPEPSLEELLRRLRLFDKQKTSVMQAYYLQIAAGLTGHGEAIVLAAQAMVILIDHAKGNEHATTFTQNQKEDNPTNQEENQNTT